MSDCEGKDQDPQQDQEVHYQEDAVDPGTGGSGQFGTDVVQAIAVFPLPEFAFNGDSLQVFFTTLGLELLNLFAMFVGDRRWPAQWFAGKANAVFLEKLPVVPTAVTRITEDDLGVIPVPAMVGLHLGLEIMAFVKSIPAQVVDSSKAFAGETYA